MDLTFTRAGERRYGYGSSDEIPHQHPANLFRRRETVMTMHRVPLRACCLAVMAMPAVASAQDGRAEEIIDLNRRIMHEQIIERDAGLFQEVSLEQFLVVAPGGRVESKAEAIGGVSAWNAESIEIRDEQVIFHDDTAVLIGRLQIDGEMQPVGALPPMKFMAVFVESADGWRILSRSLTPCFDMAIEHGFC